MGCARPGVPRDEPAVLMPTISRSPTVQVRRLQTLAAYGSLSEKICSRSKARLDVGRPSHGAGILFKPFGLPSAMACVQPSTRPSTGKPERDRRQPPKATPKNTKPSKGGHPAAEPFNTCIYTYIHTCTSVCNGMIMCVCGCICADGHSCEE